VKGRQVYVVVGIIGLVFAVAGILESFRLFDLISLERQGKCDWLPCADQGTYLSLAVVLALTCIGIAVFMVAVLKLRTPRS
jgi:hypothetical protein